MFKLRLRLRQTRFNLLGFPHSGLYRPFSCFFRGTLAKLLQWTDWAEILHRPSSAGHPQTFFSDFRNSTSFPRYGSNTSEFGTLSTGSVFTSRIKPVIVVISQWKLVRGCETRCLTIISGWNRNRNRFGRRLRRFGPILPISMVSDDFNLVPSLSCSNIDVDLCWTLRIGLCIVGVRIRPPIRFDSDP